MANLYVDARSGNDGNSGADWANAKKTLGATLTAAASNDTIKAAGVFNEIVSIPTGKNLTIEGVGFAILDGGLSLANGFLFGASSFLAVTIKNFIVKNYTSAGISLNATTGGTIVVEDCIFEHLVYGAYPYNATYPTLTFRRCLFRNCNAYYHYNYSSTTLYPSFLNCTFADCGTVYSTYQTGVYGVFTKCVFSHNTYHIVLTPTQSYVGADNCMNFGAGKCYKSGDITSLSAWQALGFDIGGTISADPLFLDRTKKIHRLKRTTPAVISGNILGAFNTLLAEGASNNLNATIWNNPVISPLGSVEKDGSGNYVLASGYTEGSATFEFDFGTARRIRRVNLQHDYAGLGSGIGGGPNGILDYDETDTLPETWEYRVAVDTGSGYGAFTEKNLFDDLNLSGVVKMKIEITLRSDA